MPGSPEKGYINQFDKPPEAEIERLALLAEELVIDAMNRLPGLKARLSTVGEDDGRRDSADMGPKQTIDVVVYDNKHPIMGIQVTISEDPKTRKRKLEEIMNKPFIRLTEMKASDMAIPKTLVYISRDNVRAYDSDKTAVEQDQIKSQVLDGIIKSLQFDLSMTKNPEVRLTTKQLIDQLQEQEKRQSN